MKRQLKICEISTAATTAVLMFADVGRNLLENNNKNLDSCFQEFRQRFDVADDVYSDAAMRVDYFRIAKRQRKANGTKTV